MFVEKILEYTDEYDQVTKRLDPSVELQKRGIEIVKQFITDRKLIIYGGTAIDFALRLKGDKIYSDYTLSVPDLDFYSLNNNKDSRDLADLVYKITPESRVINARHASTRRVDVENNHWIADITQISEEFARICKTVTYQGMLCTHPIMQYSDLHHSLAFPYEEPPTETIFQRWNKDVARFNKLYALYPVKHAPYKEKQKKYTHNIARSFILAGQTAYAAIYQYMRAFITMSSDIISADFDIVSKSEFTISSFEPEFEILHFDTQEVYEKMPDIKLQYTESCYGPSFFISPAVLKIYSTKHEMISMNYIKIDDVDLRVCNIQYLLHTFISNYAVTNNEYYAHLYTSLLKMIDLASDLPRDKINLKWPVFLSSEVYGLDNKSQAYLNAIHRIEAAHGMRAPLVQEPTYRPAKFLVN